MHLVPRSSRLAGTNSKTLGAIAGSGKDSQTAPSSTAAAGIPYTAAVDSSSAMVYPPDRRISSRPDAPSSPMPVSNTPSASAPRSRAMD